MVKRWHPTPQECELIADMLTRTGPKAALPGQGAGAAGRERIGKRGTRNSAQLREFPSQL
jgi:hypothetical protein